MLIDVRMYVEKKALLQSRYVPAAPKLCTNALHLLVYVLHVPTVLIYARILNMKTISTAVRTHLLHLLLFLVMHVCTKAYALVEPMRDYTPISHNCCTYCAHIRAVREGCIHVLIHGTYLLTVRNACLYLSTHVRKKRKPRPTKKKLAGEQRAVEAVTTPRRGLNRTEIIA